jgi:sugar phosphate isomerase/epimerase
MAIASRRAFLKGTLGLAAGACLPSLGRAIEPIRRAGKSHLRLSIAGYSYRKYLDLKAKSMDLEGFASIAAEMGVDAIEPTAYYFADTSPAHLARLRGHCIRLGLDISGGAIGNNFCVADPAALKEQIATAKQWIERYSLLGAKSIRIFAGSVPRGEAEETARARCVAAIQEACDHAGKHAIYLALENHGGITATPEQLLAIVHAVKHEWFGVNFDSGNFRTADPYGDLARIAPYAIAAQIKTEIQKAGASKEEADLPRLVKMLRNVNYRGYVALEYEAAEEPKTAIPRYVEALKKLMG